MRYIDADAVHEFVNKKVAEGKDGWSKGVPYEWAFALTVIDNAPTADIIPMKEYGQWILCKERLPKEAGEYLVKGTYKGDTKTWKCQFLSLGGIGGWSNDARNPIVSAWWEPADVVPREEVDNLKVEFDAMRSAANSYKMHYQNIAKEIFEEIDKILSDDVQTTYDCNGNAYHRVYFEDLTEDIAELKKKYAEDK